MDATRAIGTMPLDTPGRCLGGPNNPGQWDARFTCPDMATHVGRWQHFDIPGAPVDEVPICAHHVRTAPLATRAHFTARPI